MPPRPSLGSAHSNSQTAGQQSNRTDYGQPWPQRKRMFGCVRDTPDRLRQIPYSAGCAGAAGTAGPAGAAGASAAGGGAGWRSITLRGVLPRPAKIASVRLVTKNTVARIAVVRLRKFAEPRAPKTVDEAPLPNAAPMSAPFPCCSSTSTTSATATNRCRTNNTVVIRSPIAAAQAAARQMARKSSATSDAPPISPPSMSGCPNSATALSALTLPP